MDVYELIQKFQKEEFGMDLKVGGKKVVEVKLKGKNIDLDITDKEKFKELIRMIRE